MKPRGLTNAHKPEEKPYAVVQLRQDNKLGTLYNMVGFQTKLKYADQVKVFRTIPGLENAEFARLGGLHRNTFLNSPRVLDGALAAEGGAAPALCRAGHGRRRLCGERRHGADGGAHGRRRGAGPALPRAAADHGAWRAHQPHHRRAHRDDRRAEIVLPADERQFRPVPADREGEDEGRRAPEAHRTGGGAQARLHRARDGGFRRVAGGGAREAAE